MKKHKNTLLWGILYLYVFVYLFIYLAFILLIAISHLTYSVESISIVILPFVILLFIEWIIWKASLNKKNEKQKRDLKTITVVGGSLFLCCAMQLGINEYNSKFDRDVWIEKENKRVYIVDDLLEKHQLVGKSKQEILQLLGKPTETESFMKTNQIVYYLGDERGLIRIDSERLIVNFDEKDRVIEYKIHKD